MKKILSGNKLAVIVTLVIFQQSCVSSVLVTQFPISTLNGKNNVDIIDKYDLIVVNTHIHRAYSLVYGFEPESSKEFRYYYKSFLRKYINQELSGCLSGSLRKVNVEMKIEYSEPRDALWYIGLLYIWPMTLYWPFSSIRGTYIGTIDISDQSGIEKSARFNYSNNFDERIYFYSFYRDTFFEEKLSASIRELISEGANGYCKKISIL